MPLPMAQKVLFPFPETVPTKRAAEPTNGCVKCGLCAEKCPVQAIDPVTFQADAKTCIGCMRCMKQCPSSARKVNGLMVSIAGMAIKKACSVRKENELYLSK